MVAGPVPNVLNGEFVAVPPLIVLFGKRTSIGETQVVTKVSTELEVAAAVT
jgi:hypothetical protein